MHETPLGASCESGGIPTVIRSAESDFRGFLGDLQREVKPYMPTEAAHKHADEAEMLPWFRIMTYSDPHYIRGYRVGARVLWLKGKWQDAKAFLQEGIANNEASPQLFLLYNTQTMMYLAGRDKDDCPWQDDAMQLALQAAEKSFQLALPQRPTHGEPEKRKKNLVWNLDLEEDFLYVAHMRVLLNEDLGNHQAALQAAEQLVKLAPDFLPGQRSLERLQSKSQ